MKINSLYALNNRIFLIFTFAIILYSCAQIVPLSGGEKDITPPKELTSVPLNRSLNFDASTITVEFDEFIQLIDLNTQLIISPIIQPKPEITVKGKKLVIKILNDLSPNTTYSINFGNAICDITENNSFPNYKFVFSTGDFLDSLSYAGNVLNAFNLEPEEKVNVLLYAHHHDSVPLKELPNYIALTNKEGEYELTNIAKGTYKIFALKDINNNYLFDLPNEKIGFQKELVILTESQTNNTLYLFEEPHQKQYIKKIIHSQYGKVDIVFNLPTNDLSITLLNMNNQDLWSIEKNKKRDSLSLWLTPDNNPPTLNLVLTDNNNWTDTIHVKLIKELKDSTLILQNNITSNFNLNQPIVLKTHRPIVKLDTNQIQLWEDSVAVNFKLLNIANDARRFQLNYSFKENTNYQLLILPLTFTDVYGLANDSIRSSFKTKSSEDYGNIFLTLSPDFTENYIVQLYRGEKLITTNSYLGAQKIIYQYLSPGIYYLKLIIDTNKNGEWDSGNYTLQEQPEKVIFYQKEINIRANWDNQINWLIGE